MPRQAKTTVTRRATANLCSISQNQGKTASLPVLPHMAPLEIKASPQYFIAWRLGPTFLLWVCRGIYTSSVNATS